VAVGGFGPRLLTGPSAGRNGIDTFVGGCQKQSETAQNAKRTSSWMTRHICLTSKFAIDFSTGQLK